ASELDLAARVVEYHLRRGDMARVRQIEARRDDLASAPVHHLGHFFRTLIDPQDQQSRLRMILGDRLGDRLQHHRLARFGRRDDQRALAEAERANEIDDTLDVGGALARRPGRFEGEGTAGMDRAQRREFGPAVELRDRQTVYRGDAPILERYEIATSQTRDADCRVPLGGQIAVRRQAECTAFRRWIEPAGDGRHGGYISARCDRTIFAISVSLLISTTAHLRLPTA